MNRNVMLASGKLPTEPYDRGFGPAKRSRLERAAVIGACHVCEDNPAH